MSNTTPQAEPTKMQAIMEHLRALRNVIFISAIAILVGFVAVFYLAIDVLMGWITTPIVARGIEIIYTAMSEALMVKFKVAIVAGIVLASPVVIWQLWSFISPALYKHEKKMFISLFFASLILFLIGIMFCYSAVYLLAVDFFIVAGENLATPMLSIDKYVGFMFGFIVPFGVAFMLPVFIYVTTKMGWTTYEMLAGKRKFVILGIAVFAAFLTPPDVVSQVMLGVPMVILYEVGAQIARFVKPKEKSEYDNFEE